MSVPSEPAYASLPIRGALTGFAGRRKVTHTSISIVIALFGDTFRESLELFFLVISRVALEGWAPVVEAQGDV